MKNGVPGRACIPSAGEWSPRPPAPRRRPRRTRRWWPGRELLLRPAGAWEGGGAPHDSDDDAMPPFVALAKWTDEGIRKDSPKRGRAFEDRIEPRGL